MNEKRLTKSELVTQIASETGLTKADVRRVIGSMQENIIDAVSQGKRVTLTNFMSFVAETRNGRQMVNPRTREEMFVKEHQIVRSTALKDFADRVKA